MTMALREALGGPDRQVSCSPARSCGPGQRCRVRRKQGGACFASMGRHHPGGGHDRSAFRSRSGPLHARSEGAREMVADRQTPTSRHSDLRVKDLGSFLCRRLFCPFATVSRSQQPCAVHKNPPPNTLLPKGKYAHHGAPDIFGRRPQNGSSSISQNNQVNF